jgi:hypothetical protein
VVHFHLKGKLQQLHFNSYNNTSELALCVCNWTSKMVSEKTEGVLPYLTN